MNVVLYGPSNSGKTTVATSFPKPLLHLDINEFTAEVLKGIDGITTMSITDPEEVEDIYWWLKDHPEKFRTVVDDSLGQYQDMLISKRSGDGSKILTKRDWGDVSGKMKSHITNLVKLPINTVFIAHDRVFQIETEDEESDLPGQVITTPEVGPSVMPSVAKVLNASVGIIGNTFVLEETARKSKTVDGKKRKFTERSVTYCARVGPHAVYRSKVRKPLGFEVPPYIPNPTYEKFQQIIRGKYNG